MNNVDFILMTNHTERMRLTTGGKVGIGVMDPTDQLEVHTTLERSGITLVNDRTDDNAHTEIRFNKGGQERWSLGCDLAGNGGQDFFLWDALNTRTPLRVDGDGRVGIGNVDLTSMNSSLYKLYVEGGVICRDVKVTIDQFQDLVFAKEYELMSMKDLRAYLSAHGHLPTMPTGSTVEAEGGMEVGDMQMRLLRTVEEQALYILQLEERLKAVEAKLGH